MNKQSNINIQKLFLALFIAVSVGAASGQAPRRALQPEESSIKGTVDMPLNISGHLPVIEAKINGKGPYLFELDTGFGGMVEANERIIKELNLPVIDKVKTGDPSGRNPVTVQLHRADTVEVGSARFTGVAIGKSINKGPIEIDGVIGLNLFYKLNVSLDYVNDRFRLSEGNAPADSGLVYSTEQGVPSIEIEVNGVKTKVDIDSGSPAELTLPLKMVKTLPLKSDPVFVGRGRMADGEFEIYGSELKGEVNAGGIILKNPRIDFISVMPIGNLGFRFLQKLIVTFDPANKRVRFEKASSKSGVDQSHMLDLATLAKSPGGARVVAYFAAFNSGDEEKLRAFFTENISPASLKERPVEPRLEFHRQVRGDFQTISIKKVVSVADAVIKILAQSPASEWVSYTFELDPATSKINGVRIEHTDPPIETSKTAAPATNAEVITATDRLLSDLAKAGNFSGVVMIAKDDKPIFSKAYGYADAEKKAANNVDTRFNLGSINKLFTRIAIGQLVRQGKLSYEDKLIKILPDYPNRDAAAKITIGHLINMTSGVGDFFNEKFDAVDKKTLRSNKDYLPLFGGDPLEFEPGTKNRYSNGGYLVLGLVIEKISGKSYYDFVRENIFKPADMINTDSYALDALPANTAIGYLPKNGDSHQRNESMQPARGSSAGGGYSTADDLLKFSNALRSKKLLIPDDKGEFPAEFKDLGIAGGSPGVNATFSVNGQTGYTVIVLSNYDPPRAERPDSQIRAWLKNIKE